MMVLDFNICLIKKTSRECVLIRTTHGILEPDIRISMSPIESVSNSSHKAGSSEPACFSVLATIQQKYLWPREEIRLIFSTISIFDKLQHTLRHDLEEIISPTPSRTWRTEEDMSITVITRIVIHHCSTKFIAGSYQWWANGSEKGSHCVNDTVHTSQLLQDSWVNWWEDLFNGHNTIHLQCQIHREKQRNEVGN